MTRFEDGIGRTSPPRPLRGAGLAQSRGAGRGTDPLDGASANGSYTEETAKTKGLHAYSRLNAGASSVIGL